MIAFRLLNLRAIYFQSGHKTAGYVDRGVQSVHKTAGYVEGGFSLATRLLVMWKQGGGTSEIAGIKFLIKQNDQIFEAFLPNLEHSLSKELLEVLFRYVQKLRIYQHYFLSICRFEF